MVKTIIYFIFSILLGNSCYAIGTDKYYSYEYMCDIIYDSLNLIKPNLKNINYDSLYQQCVIKETKEFVQDLGADYLSYPYGIWPKWYNEDYPSPTELRIMREDYNISSENINHGFNDDQYPYIHFDTMMKRKIQNKFGKDIFDNVRNEAKKLDKKGNGLNLPKIKGRVETQFTLRNILGYTSSDSITCDRVYSIRMEIDTLGKIADIWFVSYGQHGSTMPFQCDALNTFKDRIKRDLNSLIWLPATFRRKPIKSAISISSYDFSIWFL